MIKIVVNLFRYFVGGLFIFSGLIKLNDPLGFSYKLEEYFSPDVFDISFLIPLVLPMAIFIVIFEVVLGIFLIVGFKKKFTLWSLLLMIVFFTFLTWYSAYFDAVKDCGCFGDAIKLTPWESFTKDLILLVMISLLFFKKDLINPLFNLKIQKYITIASIFLCVFLTYYVLNHLPIIDFRPYKIGANLIELKKDCIELGLPCDKYSGNLYRVKENGSGEISEMYQDEYLANFEKYEFIELIKEAELIEEGYNSPILDFNIIDNEGNDITFEFLNNEKLLIFTSYEFEKFPSDAVEEIIKSSKKAKANGFEVVGLFSYDVDKFITENNFNFKFYPADTKVLQTMVRSNPGAIILKSGVVTDKKHYNDFSDLNFE